MSRVLLAVILATFLGIIAGCAKEQPPAKASTKNLKGRLQIPDGEGPPNPP